MTDPFKYPATTAINLHSDFVPNPRFPGVSIPVPKSFTPADNPTTFDQAEVQNKTKTHFVESINSRRSRGQPKLTSIKSSQESSEVPKPKRGRPKTNIDKHPFPQT